MLILTRKTGQTVYIGDDIILTVASKSWHSVAFDIEAPAGTRIRFGDAAPVALTHRVEIPRGETFTLLPPGDLWCEVTVFRHNVIRSHLSLGFHAPRLLPVHREEVAQRIARGIPKPVARMTALGRNGLLAVRS